MLVPQMEMETFFPISFRFLHLCPRNEHARNERSEEGLSLANKRLHVMKRNFRVALQQSPKKLLPPIALHHRGSEPPGA